MDRLFSAKLCGRDDHRHHHDGKLRGAFHMQRIVQIAHVVFIGGDRLRIDDHGNDRHQEGDSECLQYAAYQEKGDEPWGPRSDP